MAEGGRGGRGGIAEVGECEDSVGVYAVYRADSTLAVVKYRLPKVTVPKAPFEPVLVVEPSFGQILKYGKWHTEYLLRAGLEPI